LNKPGRNWRLAGEQSVAVTSAVFGPASCWRISPGRSQHGCTSGDALHLCPGDAVAAPRHLCPGDAATAPPAGRETHHFNFKSLNPIEPSEGETNHHTGQTCSIACSVNSYRSGAACQPLVNREEMRRSYVSGRALRDRVAVLFAIPTANLIANSDTWRFPQDRIREFIGA
ncbi:hypothetical protein IHE44_0003150, partial [Lamprotornis superbus]